MKHADLLAGVSAFSWATTALFVPELATLCSSTVAFAFGVTAVGRWLAAQRKPAK
jgi:hypothetical protein